MHNCERTEQELKESHSRYRDLVELAVDGILMGSNEGIIIDANTCMCSLTGWSRKELIGKHISKTIFKQESLDLVPLQFDNLRNGEVVVNERIILRPDNSELSIEMRTKMMPNGTFQAIFRDITQRKKAEQEIKQKNEELKMVIADRDKLFSIIAHDLRSPFNTLLGFTKMMAEDLNSMSIAEIHKKTILLRKSAERLFGLLDNLLNWTMLKQGLISFEPDSINFTTACNEAIEALLTMADVKGITIKPFTEEKIFVTADMNMFRTIMRNLVSNAIKFSNLSGTISIDAKKSDSGILISVADSGIGMEPSKSENLFEMAKMNSTKGTEGEQGTGLGLLLCKEFVEKHGGKIWVRSEAGSGTTFFFTLPDKTLPVL